MPGGAPRVLVVEDDPTLRDALAIALRSEGYDVRAEADGLRAASAADAFRPDLAVLDVDLGPGPSGLSVARTLRGSGDVPIIFLTAADALEDRLAGFQAGGDDYLTKPFAMPELLVRIRALLRRTGAVTSDAWSVGDLVVDEAARTASRDGQLLDLTRTEFDLLVALGRNPGRVLSKTQLLDDVWGFDDYDPNLVEVHVSALRRKLEAHGPRIIHTIRGVGYAMRP